ncbi:uroporphyrinogen-III synthase [Bacillus sp. H-16]|uniref:uroporphyrinogen-III synthase n=1 Tax=Alteribacter salitolerans TaxID=2912333 RepID=UPI0019622DF7|nr:uroporphyrinogen-III synthase [Alteribacter salitolerans]MBM7096564.1 uroporphyrinogen-III synthase [Alteribacter salitolerans]
MTGGLPSLKGLKIANTRAAHQAAPFTRQIEAFGATALEVPLISVQPAGRSSAFFQSLKDIDRYTAVVFTSANAIIHTLTGLSSLKLDKEILRGKTIACVGEKTKMLLEDNGITPHLVPEVFDGEHLAEVLVELLGKNDIVLFPKSNLARNVIETSLKEAGIELDAPVAYITEPNEKEAERLRELARDQKVDVIPFLSPSAVKAFFSSGPKEVADYPPETVKLAAIGPVTLSALESLGIKNVIVPEEYTTEALLQEIDQTIRRNER